MAKIKTLQKIGTSRGIVIDKAILELLDLDHDSATVELEITQDGLLLKPSRVKAVCKEISKKHRKSLDKLGEWVFIFLVLKRNHAFIDGNKRTALATALIFLNLNGYFINEKHEEDLADLVISLVNKQIGEDTLASELRKRLTKSNHKF